VTKRRASRWFEMSSGSVSLLSEGNIAPWKCHVCDLEFDIPEGGICKECGKPACLTHLRASDPSGSLIHRSRSFICTDCNQADLRQDIEEME